MLLRIQHRRGTAAQWTSENPILAPAELGFETDTGKFKVGNGITAWTGLKYFQNFDDIKSSIVDAAPAALDTLNELAQALNDDASFASTITGLLANKAPLNSPNFSGTVDFSNSIVTGIMLPINWLGEYSNTAEYLENDMVQYEGSTYYATGPNLNFEDGYYPTALNADWELFASKGDQGEVGPMGPVGTIDPATPFVEGKVLGVTNDSSDSVANAGLGFGALSSITTGTDNVAIGYKAGYAVQSGNGNVFLGNYAGFGETGSDKLYIANSDTTQPLIGGDFAAKKVDINGAILEKYSLTASAPASTQTFYVQDGPIKYFTSNAANNWTLNVSGASGITLNSLMVSGQAITIAVLVTNGATAYYPTGFQVDGSSVTVKWQGGIVPSTGNTNSIDLYSYTVIKNGSGFTVLGSQTKFA